MNVPRKRELTWQDGSGKRNGRWKKFYHGKAYYFPHGTSKSDVAGYKQALRAWKAKKAELYAEKANRPKPHQEDYDRAIEEWRLVLQWSLDHDDERTVCIARDKLKELRARLTRKEPSPVSDDDRLWSRFRWPKELLDQVVTPLGVTATVDVERRTTVVPGPRATKYLDGSPNRIAEEVWRDRIESQRGKVDDPDRSVAANVKAFLAIKEGQVRAGELSAGRYTPIKLHLEAFCEWLGPATDVSVINGKVLSEYHADLVQSISRNDSQSEPAFAKRRTLSRDYARDRISEVKTFVRWLYETDVIDTLPKILTNKRALTISKKLASPETFTIEEVKLLLSKATPRTKLYLLLMLNCGMYQKDISDLTPAEVDWKTGRITRKRSKTKSHENVPTVKYLGTEN